MTTQIPNISNLRRRFGHKLCIGTCIRIGAAVFAAVLLLYQPSLVSEGIRRGMTLCVRAVVPSLFPFLVLSPLLSDAVCRMTVRLCRRADERTAALTAAFAVGMLTGFPIGALTLLSLYEQGRISRTDAARFLGVCTAASPAFLIGCFGQALWGNAVLGYAAYVIQVIVCIIGFLILLRTAPRTESAIASASVSAPPSLADALGQAVPRMVQICGAVLFFSVLRAFLFHYLDDGGICLAVLLSGFAEMTGGLSDAAALYVRQTLSVRSAYLVSAAVIGFGGGCVGMQIADAAMHAGVSMRQYWIQRLMLAAVGVLVVWVLAMGLGG